MITLDNRMLREVDFLALVFDMDISERSNYKDFVWAIELNRFGLELVGVWPEIGGTTNNFANDLRMGFFLVLTISICIIPLLCSLVRVWGNIIFMTENLQFTLPLLAVVIKLVIMRWKRTAFSSIMKTIAEDWMELKEDAERDVMVRRARIARLIAIAEYIMMIFTFVAVVVLPCIGIPVTHAANFTNQNRLLPLQLYYFYDTDNSPQYELTFAAQVVTIVWSALVYMSTDALLGLMIFHLCGQLENLRCRMINLIFWKDFNSALRNNVHTHLRLIRFARNIDDMFSLMMLGLLIYFSIAFCLFGSVLLLELTDDINDSSLSRTYFAILGVVVLLINTLFYCGSGEIIENECEAVHRAICDLEWYKLECRNGRSLILLMMRANASFRITAGKIVPLTLSTFCSLLKTSAGFVSFILARRT